jgi:uroporphyrinogen-III synthase
MEIGRRHDQPLAGKTVVITRSTGDVEDLQARLSDLGARVVSYPCFVVRPLPLDPAEQVAVMGLLPRLGWVAFASRHSVAMFEHWLQRWEMSLPPTTHLAAVGPATARAVDRVFGRPCLLADPANGDGLAATLLREASPSQGPVLLPAARAGRRVVLDALNAAHFRVHFLPLYETIVEPSDTVVVPLPEKVDFVLMTSPSCVRGFLARTPLPPGARVVTIGPTTSAAAAEHGLHVHREAPTPSLDGMIEALSLE